MSITRILIIVISMSGLTRGSLVVISNIWRGWRRWMIMYTSASARKQNERDVETMLAVNEGCCTGPFNSDQACYPNKLCSFPTNMLRVCFGSLFWLPLYCFLLHPLYVYSLYSGGCFSFVINKTVYHPAMRNYPTSTLKNAINSVNYLHNRSP